MRKYLLLIILISTGFSQHTGNEFYERYVYSSMDTKKLGNEEWNDHITIIAFVAGVRDAYQTALVTAFMDAYKSEDIDNETYKQKIFTKVKELHPIDDRDRVPREVAEDIITICDIIYKYLENHPEERHKGLIQVYIDAFAEAFPPK